MAFCVTSWTWLKPKSCPFSRWRESSPLWNSMYHLSYAKYAAVMKDCSNHLSFKTNVFACSHYVSTVGWPIWKTSATSLMYSVTQVDWTAPVWDCGAHARGKRKGTLSHLLTIHWPNQVTSVLSIKWGRHAYGGAVQALATEFSARGIKRILYNGPKVIVIEHVLETFGLICIASS